MKDRFRRKGHMRFRYVEDAWWLFSQKTRSEWTEHHSDQEED
jgi:hypothetical protein